MWKKVKNVLSVVGGVALAVIAILLGRGVRDNGKRVDSIRDEHDAVADAQRRASEQLRESHERVERINSGIDRAEDGNRRVADELTASGEGAADSAELIDESTDILRRVRERREKAKIQDRYR